MDTNKGEELGFRKVVFSEGGHERAVRGFLTREGDIFRVRFPDGGELLIGLRAIVAVKQAGGQE